MNQVDKKLVVVLGMHRSGTSAITRGLHALGVMLGDRLEPPAIGINDKGYWEDIDIVSLNVEMLKAISSDWHSLAPIGAADIELLFSKGYLLRAAELLRQKQTVMPVLGFKDPRTAKLLRFWRAVFSHLNLSPSYVIAVRHPMSVMRSLQKRDKFDAEKGYYLWLEHIVPAIIETADSSRVVVDFDLLMAAPQAQLKRMAQALNLPFNPDSPSVKEYASEFLDVNLQHTRFEFEDLRIDPAVPTDVINAYNMLIRLACDEINIETPKVEDAFQQLSSRLCSLSPAFNYMARLDRRAVGLNAQIANLNQGLAERDAQIANLNQGLAERDAQIANLNQGLAERDAQIANLNQGLAERDAQIAQLREVVAGIRASTSWQITAPLRYLSFNVRNVIKAIRRLHHVEQNSGIAASTETGGEMRNRAEKLIVDRQTELITSQTASGDRTDNGCCQPNGH